MRVDVSNEVLLSALIALVLYLVIRHRRVKVDTIEGARTTATTKPHVVRDLNTANR